MIRSIYSLLNYVQIFVSFFFNSFTKLNTASLRKVLRCYEFYARVLLADSTLIEFVLQGMKRACSSPGWLRGWLEASQMIYGRLAHSSGHAGRVGKYYRKSGQIKDEEVQ